MFRDEIVEAMKQIIELKSSDLLDNEEFLGRLEALLARYRVSHDFPSHDDILDDIPFIPSEPEPVGALFAISLHGPEGKQRFEFLEREITIGRSSESHIVLRRSDVSRRHSRIIVRDGRFILLDLKSENGTYVNGKRLGSPQVVRPVDRIAIGDYLIYLEPLW